MSATRQPTFLIISQVYVPDPASVGQHIHDAAAEMARRGYRVVVLTSARGYDDPSRKYPPRELLDGVDIRRLPLSSFGKSSIAIRLLAQWLFLIQAMLRGLFMSNIAGLMVSTSPPFCGFAGAVLSKLRAVPVKYWLMDLNPDQMVALGKAKEGSLQVRIFDMFNRMILRQASEVIMLDRFMVQRVGRKGVPVAHKTEVMPPWPHETQVHDIPHDQNPFRKAHGLDGKFVVMYSGNHSPANPLTTLLDAAERLKDDPRIVFMFIGGGGGKKEIDDRIAAGATNIRSLPYQPLSEIRYSLSAADLHVVSIGDDVVGIVHPCKVYGAMSVSRAVLLLGPNPCHVSDLIANHSIGWHVHHGDVKSAFQVVRTAADTPPEALRAMGAAGGKLIGGSLSRDTLCGRLCDVLERGLRRAPIADGQTTENGVSGAPTGASGRMNAAASQPAALSAPRTVQRRSNIEVILPTFNEEINLPHALRSVCEWADAVYVVDSGSTDSTRRVAEKFGARVVDRPWLGYAAQKNWALDNLPIQSDWVFFLDADESITPELRQELLAISSRPHDEVKEAGFYVNRLTYFLGKPLRHCGYFPSYNLRLFKRGRARYEQREVHEHMIVDGPTQRLRHIMLHEDRRGLEHFIAKHNRYSTLEAREFAQERDHPAGRDPAAGESGIAYRRWLKRNVLPRLPLSGLWRFLYMYFLRLGILDGVTGLRFCLLLATYDVFISLKLAEIRSLQRTGPRGVAAPGGLAIPEGQLRTVPMNGHAPAPEASSPAAP